MSAFAVLTCPRYPWCVRHEVDDADGTVLHLSRTVEYVFLGSFHLSAATGGGCPDEPPWVVSDIGEWSPEEALALAEQFAAVIRELVEQATSDA